MMSFISVHPDGLKSVTFVYFCYCCRPWRFLPCRRPSLFLQVIFAFVPPSSYAGGWLTFIISLLLIGVLTAIIGDLASVFGCLLSVPDSITAITFVALGTSMPDTFASRAAAMNEKSADSSIGNINGSNSVNVFLGLGLPWLIASIYWLAQVSLVSRNQLPVFHVTLLVVKSDLYITHDFTPYKL